MKLAFFLLCMVFFTGCASVVSDNKYEVMVSSTPMGAEFVVYNGLNKATYSGLTPSKINLNAGQGYFEKSIYYLEFTKNGYSKGFKVLNSTVDPWFYGNLLYLPLGLFPMIIGGCVIDPLTGNMWRLPDHVHVKLNKN